MPKKRRSAKQRANDTRLGQIAKARGRKSAPKRRRSTRKVNKPRRTRRAVVGTRRRVTRKARGIISKIPLINNPTIRKAATGIGLATIGVAAVSIIAPQIAQNPIIKPALALIGGGIPGLIAQVVTQGGLSGLLGGGNGGGGGFTPGFG